MKGPDKDNMKIHTIPPTYNKLSQILILGSFPSVKSREEGYFYGHPQNRFWQVMSLVFEDELPETIESKKAFLLRHKVAVWDVIASCDITGSSDSSITNVKANDITKVSDKANTMKIYVNGRKADALYKRYIEPQLGKSAIYLPSTSPANARWSLEKLVESWKIIKS